MIITVDTGGTKTLVSSFTRSGKQGKSHKFPTPKNKEKYITVLKTLLTDLYSTKPVEAIVIAIPGMIQDGTALWCNQLKWKNFPVAVALQGVLDDAPIFVENDANLAALAAARALQPTPRSVLYVTISTGIGTGFVVNGHLDPGMRLSEGGRSLVEYDGMVREWESFASGKSIYETYGKYARDITDPKQWNHIADRISRGFLAIIPFTQPDVIVIGGSIGTYFDRYEHFLLGRLQEQLPQHIPVPHFIRATHPEEVVIHGCYHYALDQISR